MVKPIYKGSVVTLNVDTVRLPNGHTIDLEIIRHPGASAVVPLKEDGTVVLIRQFRHAANGFIYEIPAGKLHSQEDPLDCAARELEGRVFPGAIPAARLDAAVLSNRAAQERSYFTKLRATTRR